MLNQPQVFYGIWDFRRNRFLPPSEDKPQHIKIYSTPELAKEKLDEMNPSGGYEVRQIQLDRNLGTMYTDPKMETKSANAP